MDPTLIITGAVVAAAAVVAAVIVTMTVRSERSKRRLRAQRDNRRLAGPTSEERYAEQARRALAGDQAQLRRDSERAFGSGPGMSPAPGGGWRPTPSGQTPQHPGHWTSGPMASPDQE